MPWLQMQPGEPSSFSSLTKLSPGLAPIVDAKPLEI